MKLLYLIIELTKGFIEELLLRPKRRKLKMFSSPLTTVVSLHGDTLISPKKIKIKPALKKSLKQKRVRSSLTLKVLLST